MKRLIAIAMSATVAALAVPAASAAPWQSINSRQAKLDRRIDVGIRNGSLTRTEARNLRSEFHDIARLEARYRSHGLSMSERADLDRRFDALSAKIRYDRHDRDYRYGDRRY
jgi:hypothetical protein